MQTFIEFVTEMSLGGWCGRGCSQDTEGEKGE